MSGRTAGDSRFIGPVLPPLLCIAVLTVGAAACDWAGVHSDHADRRTQRGSGSILDSAVAPLQEITADGQDSLSCFLPAGESWLWQEFVYSKRANSPALLPDFSFAGYHYSERELPAKSRGPRFDVRSYGAHPNDKDYDGKAIQAAIDAAGKAGGGTVYFPPGRFLLSSDQSPESTLAISSDSIVLKGSGSGLGGTEILMDRMKADPEIFLVNVEVLKPESRHLATITADAVRESFWVRIDDSSKLREGQRVVIRYYNPAYTERYFSPLSVPAEWTRLHVNGFRVHEIHSIDKVQGQFVKFKEPLHLNLKVHAEAEFRLFSYPHLEEVGVEDIRFTGGWGAHPEEFSHHKDSVHDYGWNALRFERVVNGWIRRVEFHDFNQGIVLNGSAGITLQNIAFAGKKGHASVHTRMGYGVLVKDVLDSAGHHHGPGVGYSATGTVFLRYQMQKDQHIDSHSGSPYATLFDQIAGGVLSGNGGPYESYPHHGKHLVFWNFEHSASRPSFYDFWNTERRQSATFALPIFSGFTSNRPVTFIDPEEKVGFNESQGTPVLPSSLFEAQLRLRTSKIVEQVRL